MSLIQDVQSLEPGQYVTLYTVDASALGAEVYRFHSYGQVGSIVWQGETFEPWPVEATGFEMSTNAPASPRMKLGNVGGFITALALQFDDLIGATVTRHRTLGKYLDGQPEADPDEHFPDDIWRIEQKLAETNELVDFELASSLDFNGIQLPARPITANSCFWQYRDADCGYTGPPVATREDIITSDAELDDCGKRPQSCKLRFGANNPLPFGGFPAAGLIS